MFFRKKNKTPTPLVGSTYPSQVEHFSVKKPEAVICCFSCRKCLWVQEIRTSNGKIVSTSTLPTGDNREPMTDDPNCPLCHGPYMKVKGKKKQILVRSTKTGQEFIVGD